MKFSIYNQIFENNGKYYLYNILSTALIEIDSDILSAISSNKVTSIEYNNLKSMEKMHFIVEDNSDEASEYMYYFNTMKYKIGVKSLGIIYIPTYSCNLACTYCMQGQNKNSQIINDSTQNSLIKFVNKQMQLSKLSGIGIEKITLTIFGGEPLVAKSAVTDFCKKIRKIAEENKCRLYISMVSNGTLIDDDIIKLIKDFEINIQISIDGVKENHDKSRVRKDGSGTFDTIVSNLRKMCDNGLKDNIVIRLNTDLNNINGVEETIRQIRNYSNDIFFGFVDNFKGFNDGFTTCISHSNYSETMTDIIYPIYKKYGLKINRAFGKMSPCSICTENKFAIDCNGDVFKCEMLVNQQDAKIGVINDDGDLILNSNYYKQMSVSPAKNEKCYKCKLLPLCGGGCVGKAYIDSNRRDSNFDYYNCAMTEEDLVTYLKDYVTRNEI